MEQTTTLYLWIALGILTLGLTACLHRLSQLNRRFKSAFADLGSKKNLADTIVDYYEKVSATASKVGQLQKSYEHLAAIGARSIQKTGIVRFNPFRDTGGDQSFVLALLDNHDSGFLMTSIHGREGTRVYVKPIEYGSSKYTLSAEEQGALKAAINPPRKTKVRPNGK